jgi:carboxyl-terminal processing protease
MWWKLSFAIPLILFSLFGGSQVNSSESADSPHSIQSGVEITSIELGPKITPDDVYRRAWQLIKDEFVDQNFNGQSWIRWEHRYDGKMKNFADAHKCVETMVMSLGDKYTRFLDKEAFADEKAQIDAKLFGIGIQIAIDEKNRLIIFNSYEGTPAYRAGLKPADEIVSIDGRPTKGLTVEEAAKMIRGAVDTEVALTLRRDERSPFTIRIKRAEIPVHAVQTAKMLDNDVGYIRLSSFISQQAPVEMRDALLKLSSAKGLILDLRDNPGGLLTNAIEIANMFLTSGAIVSTVDGDGYKSRTQADGRPLATQPLVLVINQGSASAAEITSGALHDNERARLVGAKSYGKGLVQGISRLQDGSGLNITIAHYLTPNDVDINRKGIDPDYAVEVTSKDVKDGKGPWWLDPSSPHVQRQPEDMRDLQLRKAIEVVKTTLRSTSPVAVRPH